MSLWVGTVLTNLLSVLPHGTEIVEFVRSGYLLGDPTIRNFTSAHYWLPVFILGLAIVLMWLQFTFRAVEPSNIVSGQIYWGSGILRTLLSLCPWLIALAYLVCFLPDYLGLAESYTPANYYSIPYRIVPEWYLTPYFSILRAFPGKAIGVTLLLSAFGIFYSYLCSITSGQRMPQVAFHFG